MNHGTVVQHHTVPQQQFQQLQQQPPQPASQGSSTATLPTTAGSPVSDKINPLPQRGSAPITVQRFASGTAFPIVRFSSGVVAPVLQSPLRSASGIAMPVMAGNPLSRSASGTTFGRLSGGSGAFPIPHSMSATAPPNAQPQPPRQTPKRLLSVHDVGYAEDPNWAHNPYMEDERVIIDAFMDIPSYGYFGLFDGHGGREAVEFAATNLHAFFAEELRFNPDATTALKNAFWATDQAMLVNGIGLSSGCTALVAFFSGEPYHSHHTSHHAQPLYRQFLIANAGDTRAVISRGGMAMRVSIDHKATDHMEAHRVKSTGGFIHGRRVGGVTQTSRGLGDHDVPHLIPEPDVHHVKVEPGDEFLIMATDGIWDVMDDQMAVNICRQMPTSHDMAQTLVRAAVSMGTEDNCSALVIALN